MMTQKYANVSSDPNGYPHTRDTSNDTTNDTHRCIWVWGGGER
jgi:hypothetical protein